MVSAGDFRNGLTVEIDNNVYQVIEFQHVKPGKGAAFVRTKLRNIHIERAEMQYLYSDGELYYFMDTATFDQFALNEDSIGDSLKFVKENDMVKMLSHNKEVFAIEPPLFVELVITDTEPGFKGDTAQGATKPAVVETGATVYVPLFVEQGDKISIDTRTGDYLKRV
ncbi:MAG: translation elongation factor [Anaerocolumna sp.]|nr:translation elongation factor [Anaerocolumna sp.]